MAIKIIANESGGCVTFQAHPTSKSEIGEMCVSLVRLPMKLQNLRGSFRISMIAHISTQR